MKKTACLPGMVHYWTIPSRPEDGYWVHTCRHCHGTKRVPIRPEEEKPERQYPKNSRAHTPARHAQIVLPHSQTLLTPEEKVAVLAKLP